MYSDFIFLSNNHATPGLFLHLVSHIPREYCLDGDALLVYGSDDQCDDGIFSHEHGTLPGGEQFPLAGIIFYQKDLLPR